MSPDEIKELRAALGESQEAFARHLGVTLNTVYRWETGTRKPGLYYQQRLRLFRGAAKRLGIITS